MTFLNLCTYFYTHFVHFCIFYSKVKHKTGG